MMDINTMFYTDRLELDGVGNAGDYYKIDPDSIMNMASVPYADMSPASVMWSQVQDYFDHTYGPDQPDDFLHNEDEPSPASSATTHTTELSETTASGVVNSETEPPNTDSAASDKATEVVVPAKVEPSDSSPPATAIRPKKASSRRNGVSKTAGSSLPDGDKERAKRSRFLERNRIAASKCRKKKREWLHELEDTKLELEHRHTDLQHEFGSLLNEVSEMKNELMRHASCNDPNINRWIENEARRFVAENAKGLGTRDNGLEEACCGNTSERCGAFGHVHVSDIDGIGCCAHTKHEGLVSPPSSTAFSYDHMPDSMFDPEMA